MGFYLFAIIALAGYTLAVRFGENVRRIREARGLSQEDVARLLGKKRQANLSTLECGSHIPSPKRIRDLARVLKCETWELLDGVLTEYDRLRSPEELFRDGIYVGPERRRASTP